MLQRYAKLNCDYGKKLNITGCFKKLVIYLYQHSDTEEKKSHRTRSHYIFETMYWNPWNYTKPSNYFQVTDNTPLKIFCEEKTASILWQITEILVIYN